MHESPRTRAASARRAVASAVAALLIFVLLPVATAQAAASRVDLRVLVVSNGDPSADAIAAQMDREGVPYTKISVGAANRPIITADYLADAAAGRAKFQGIVLPNQAGGGLAAAEVAALVAYERTYGVRRVNAYDYPGASMGFAVPTFAGPLDGSMATVTAAGKAGPFSYLDGPLPIDDFAPGLEVYGYLAQPASTLAADESFTPLLTGTADGQSGVLAGVYAHDGREELTLTAAYNPFMQWYNAVAPGIVNWLTRGIHLGHQRNYFAVHVDDIFMNSSRWSVTGNCTPGDNCGPTVPDTADIRMTAADVTRLSEWQEANDFAMDMAYNAEGSVERKQNGGADPLTDAFLAVQGQFPWINHTYSHPYLGCIQIVPTVAGQNWRCATSATDSPREDPGIQAEMSGGTLWMSAGRLRSEIADNIAWATANGLTDFDRRELVTGEHSGLRTTPQQENDNPFLAPVLSELGILQIASDASRETAARPVGSATTVPRHPMNIFYNTATYSELIDEYNWIYVSRTQGGSGICDDNPATTTCITPLPAGNAAEAKASYDNYLRPIEVRNALRFVLDNDPAPFYSHQANLAEDGLLYPVVAGILAQYRSIYADSAPIVRTDMAGQHEALARLTSWRDDNDRVTGYIDASGIHVPDASGDVAITVPAGTTSVSGVTLESYAGDLSGWASGQASAVPPTPMGGYNGSQEAPGTPTIGQATGGDASATVSWTAPTGAVAGYEIRAYTREAPTVVAARATVAGSAVSGTVSLVNGTFYTLRVAALNATGTAGPESDRSNEVQAVAPSAPPTIVERTPAVDASGVPTTTDVIVKFSESVTGVSGTTVTLTRTGGESVPATVAYEATTSVATLDPGPELDGTTQYTVNVTSGIRDDRGVALAPASWSFTTAGAVDTTAPTVTTRVPAAAATGVSAANNLSATFSEAVQGVGGSTFTLRTGTTTGTGTAVAAAVTYAASTRVATLAPDADLVANTTYTATLTGGTGAIRDAANNPLVTTSWQFTTAQAPATDPPADTTPPPAPTVDPASGTSASARTVTMSSAESGAVIRYTTGADPDTLPDPTATSTQYTGPITVGTSQVIKAAAFDAAGNRSPITQRSYTITPATGSTRTVVLTPVADTMARQVASTTTSGSLTTLLVDSQETTGNSATRATSYLRFTVPALAAGESIASANLSLNVTNATTDGPTVWRTATSWSESAMTWRSGQPARQGTSPVGNFGAMAVGRATTPVSGITTSGTVSYQLFAAVSNDLQFSSREAATDTRPHLVLTITRG